MPTPKMQIDARLLDFCETDAERDTINAIIEHGSLNAAARARGYGSNNPDWKRLRRIRRRAALRGYAPEHDMQHVAPETHIVKGASTLYNTSGRVVQQWVKTQVSPERIQEAFREWVEDLVEHARGKSPAVKPPRHAQADLLAVYPLGDPHFGLYAWAAEAGADFDLSTAERYTVGAVERLVASAPPAQTAVVIALGDFFHADDSRNVTPRSMHALDTDTRWPKVMQIGLRAMVRAILCAAAKHERVVVRIVKGNHDPHASFALALGLDAYFSNNDRITVELSPAAHWYYRFGRVLIGATHGDQGKHTDLPAIMAHDRAEDWGATRFRYWYVGHVHNTSHREHPGVIVETFRTIAARDAWTSGMGYRAGRDMRLIVHHSQYGEIERHRCDVAMVEEVEA